MTATTTASYNQPVLCQVCGKAVVVRRRGQVKKYCNKVCASRKYTNKYRTLNPRLGLAAGTVGALGELLVAADLLKRGYEVFRAMSPSCSCDLAVLKNGKLMRVEVRTGYRSGQRSVDDPDNVFIGNASGIHRADLLAIVVHSPTMIQYRPQLDPL